jgi:hypothetical protein
MPFEPREFTEQQFICMALEDKRKRRLIEIHNFDGT